MLYSYGDCVCVMTGNQAERCHSSDMKRLLKSFPLYKVCKYGNVGLVRFMMSNCRQQSFSVGVSSKWRSILEMIVVEGRYQILEVLSSHLTTLFEQHKPRVSEFQHCVYEAVNRRSVWGLSILLKLLMHLHGGIEVFENAFDLAAKTGNWPIILFLKRVKSELDSIQRFNEAPVKNQYFC